jgi:hypothetical protein
MVHNKLNLILKKAKSLKKCNDEHPHNYYTCYDKEELLKIAHNWNIKNPLNIIDIPSNISHKALWIKVKSKLTPFCNNNEVCWSRVSGAYHSSPAHKCRASVKDGLTNINILKTFRVISRIYPSITKKYMFLGVFPINFLKTNDNNICIGDLLCTFNLSDLQEKHKKEGFGVVFNTDPLSKPGDHWIAFWCCINPESPNYGLYFYDSNSVQNPKRHIPTSIHKLKDRLLIHSKNMNLQKFKFHYNSQIHQESDGPCGLFCISFLVSCMLDYPIKEYLKSKHVNDGFMMDIKEAFFN